MAASNARNLGLGIFILAGLLLLTAFVYYIGANQSLFGASTQVSTLFRNIAGLQPGANVRFSGINVGTVEGIQIVSDTSVKVFLRVDNGVVRFIKKDSHVSIGSDGIMGDKVVNISPGSAGQPAIQGGDLLASEEPLQMDSIFATAQRMVGTVNTITTNVADMTSSIRNGHGVLGKLMYDDGMARSTGRLLAGLNTTVRNLNQNLENTKTGTAAFSENMKALQGNVLLRGYFKKKERARQDSIKEIEKAARRRQEALRDSVRKEEKAARKQARADRREARRQKRRIMREGRIGPDKMQAGVNVN